MNNTDFWASVRSIIADGFTSEGLHKLNTYAEQFISGRLVYQRFSSREQYGCATGGEANIIASLLAAAEDRTNKSPQGTISDFQRERKRGTSQENVIEQWAKSVGLWIEHLEDMLYQAFGNYIAEGGEAIVYDHGGSLVKSIGLDYFILPILALDRIALHNAYFPETRLKVLGFGRNANGEFKIICEQPFIAGTHISDNEITSFMRNLGFELRNPRNWTYATPEIYLSDLHDENVIRSANGAICVIDCDIRINTPKLKQGGIRELNTNVYFQ